MKRNLRVGIDCTKRCNWKCKTCFYRYRFDFNTDYDKSVAEVMKEASEAAGRGCNHVVFVGWGEPGLWPNLIESIKEIGKIGMTSSIITNGSVAIAHYAKMREAGLNHLHISAHGIGPVLDEIAGFPGAGARQEALFKWLKDEKWDWRMNMTVQRLNYHTLADIASLCIDHGCKHIISLGFLPHYEWNDPNKMAEVAVHPAELRPFIEKVAKTVEAFNHQADFEDGVMFTIRYHPMCHLSEKYRKYVTNALYVLYSPGEWDYESAGLSEEAHWNKALSIGGSVSIEEAPCSKCGLKIHCGGWNKVYAAGFNGAELRAIPMHEETMVKGWLHDQNPSNRWQGWF